MKFNTELVRQVQKLMVAELEAQVEQRPEARIDGIELVLRQMMSQIGAACLEAYLTAQDPPYPEATTLCPCGGKAEYRFRREGKLLSVFDWVRYRRAYYVCPGCHAGQYPLDERLGLEPGQVTAGLASLLGIAGVETSFERGSAIVDRFLFVRVSENTVRKETQNFGQLQAVREKEWVAESQDAEHYRERHRTAEKRLTRLYGSIDGAHVPVEEGWREMKIGCWYLAKPVPKSQVPAGRRDRVGENGALRAKEISYYSDMLSAKEFGPLLWATGCQRGADLAKEVVFVADGAAWIWKLISFYFPEAIQIVDWYHAETYLERVAEEAFGQNQQLRTAWLEEVRDALWEGEIDAVLGACGEWADHPRAGQAAREAISYYTNNRKRMDYARFRQQGYLIGSGTVESGCKQIVTQRLKRSGARWTEKGARATGKARAAWLSDQWDQLTALRAQLPPAANNL